MKVLHIMGMNSKKFGGLERFMLALSKYDPTDSHILAYNSKPESERFVEQLGNESLRFFNNDFNQEPMLIVNYIKLLREVRPDAVHFHFGNTYGVLTVISKLLGIKKIYKTQHSSIYQNNSQIYDFKKLSLSAKIYTLWGKSFNMMTAVLPVSKAVAIQMKSVFGDSMKIQPVYIGISAETRPGSARFETEERNLLTISCISFASPIKGPDIMIQALHLVKDLDIKLYLIGLDERSSYTTHLREMADSLDVNKKIKWVGITDDVAQYLAMSDVYVQPSQTEALSLAAVEAASLGLPVVGSDAGGLPEIATITFPNGDYHKLAEIIRNLCIHKDYRVSLGQASFEKFERSFTLNKTLEQYHSIYHS